MSIETETPQRVWYITELWQVVEVDAYPRDYNYFWIPSHGYSASLGYHVFHFES